MRINFEQSPKEDTFLDIWQKADVIPVQKKSYLKEIKKYCPVTLLPIFSIIFENLTYDSLFNIFKVTNFLLLDNQVFYLMIYILWNYSQLNINYKQYLIAIYLFMWDVYFLASQELLINSFLLDFYSNFKLIGLNVIYLL